jgi:energy-coupling factor transporter ATP-binding protein EcfA2
MSETIIQLKSVSYHYPRAKRWALKKVSLEIRKGEFIAVMAKTARGKRRSANASTARCRTINEGVMKGNVECSGTTRRTARFPTCPTRSAWCSTTRKRSSFTTSVRNEVAFGAENLCVPMDEILRRIDWALGIVGLTDSSNNRRRRFPAGRSSALRSRRTWP